PAHQRKILNNPKNLPHEAIIQLGSEQLQLLVNAIYDKAGEYIGPMITWEVVTEKLRMENEMQRIQQMVENSPTNMIFADRDFNIRFLNPASKDTLRSLEHLLPVKSSDVLGRSVDIFHKDPAYQRRIIGDPKNLPHRAIIGLGPEKLDLLVSA